MQRTAYRRHKAAQRTGGTGYVECPVATDACAVAHGAIQCCGAVGLCYTLHAASTCSLLLGGVGMSSQLAVVAVTVMQAAPRWGGEFGAGQGIPACFYSRTGWSWVE